MTSCETFNVTFYQLFTTCDKYCRFCVHDSFAQRYVLFSYQHLSTDYRRNYLRFFEVLFIFKLRFYQDEKSAKVRIYRGEI